MPYLLHPSKKLVAHFKEKPWQGCNPKDAEFLFIGLDANYAADVEATLPELFDYHHCGVNFWHRHKIHHPFLLPHYRGSGKKYHQKFAQIGFTEAHAERVSFLELLHLPTVGTNKLEIKDLSHSHLELLADVLNQGAARFVFMPAKVVTTLKQTALFDWLPQKPVRVDGNLGVLREKEGQTIYQMYHLSCYGWQQGVLDAQLGQVRAFLDLTERTG